MIEIIKRRFSLTFSMLEDLIESGSENLWDKKVGGHVYFQQILHALMGIYYWFRDSDEKFVEPFLDRKLYPEFQHDPENSMTINEMIDFKNQVILRINDFFNNRSNEWLMEPSKAYNKLPNLDLILMQIRHIQYHVGYCNALLFENKEKQTNWLDYYGN